MAYDRNAPHILAIILDPEEEFGQAPVRDMIHVDGIDVNAKRRLRRKILSLHAGWIDRIIYETTPGNGGETISQDVTRHYRKEQSDDR